MIAGLLASKGGLPISWVHVGAVPGFGDGIAATNYYRAMMERSLLPNKAPSKIIIMITTSPARQHAATFQQDDVSDATTESKISIDRANASGHGFGMRDNHYSVSFSSDRFLSSPLNAVMSVCRTPKTPSKNGRNRSIDDWFFLHYIGRLVCEPTVIEKYPGLDLGHTTRGALHVG